LPTQLNINLDKTVEFLVGLLNTHSPTGYHVEAIEYVRQAFSELEMPELSMQLTRKGALLATLKGKSSEKSIGVTGHIDTLGLMVKQIKGNGRLQVTRLGGLLWGGVESEGVTIRTADNKRYRGSVTPVNTSVHVNSKIHKLERNGETMEIRIDAKTSSAKETRDLGINVGDFVFLDPRVEVLDTGFIRSRFLDDKAGVACMYGALLAVKDAGVKVPYDVHFLIANYEEVGHGGASGFPDDIHEILTVDMGALGDGQSGDEFSVSICVKDGGGPYHFDMNNKLRRLAQENDIAHNLDIYVYYASDGTSFWRAGGDAKVGLAGPGVDGSHSYERTHHDSIQHSTHLIARYMLDDQV